MQSPYVSLEAPFIPSTPVIKLPLASSSTEHLHVYCRLRPTNNKKSIEVLSDRTLLFSIPSTSANISKRKKIAEAEFTFEKIFKDSDDQQNIFDCVAKPLVENLINGKNGLLFTYGLTGSGKTYTMTGDTGSNTGIMPRCLHLIFNSIADHRAIRFVFKPDKKNVFDIQSEKDAAEELKKFGEQKELMNRSVYMSDFKCEDARIPISNDNTSFAVFITYTEIYNNEVYDLLQDIYRTKSEPKPLLEKKIIREDAARNPYVHDAVEIEVQTVEEAYNAFKEGKSRKRMAHTALNSQSSRSHSIFNIRLVQALRDAAGKIIQDKRAVTISQLSLVDLAGTERTEKVNPSQGRRLNNKALNQAENIDSLRLLETNHINLSLMALRQCLDIKRENQKKGSRKEVPPARMSKLSHLLRHFFESEGSIRMIVCLNPQVEDHDENIHIVEFAELCQKIRVKPSIATPWLSVGSTSVLKARDDEIERLRRELMSRENEIAELKKQNTQQENEVKKLKSKLENNDQITLISPNLKRSSKEAISTGTSKKVRVSITPIKNPRDYPIRGNIATRIMFVSPEKNKSLSIDVRNSNISSQCNENRVNSTEKIFDKCNILSNLVAADDNNQSRKRYCKVVLTRIDLNSAPYESNYIEFNDDISSPLLGDTIEINLSQNDIIFTKRIEHTGKNDLFSKNICNSNDESRNSSRTHIRKTSNLLVQLECTACGKLFTTEGGLQRHTRISHEPADKRK